MIFSFNCCRVNKGVGIPKQTMVLHRWENTLTEYRVLSVTCDHYHNRRRLRLPLIFVFTYLCLRKIARTVLNIWFICLFFTFLGEVWTEAIFMDSID